MKAKDLTIGDYVVFNDTPYIVQEISAKGWIHLVDAENHLRTQMSTDYIIEQIQGIPLTPEILNSTIDDCPAQLVDGKNEWQILMLHGGNYNDPAYDVIIADRDDGIYETTLINYDTGKRFDGEIRYFHELQHALRLCGIDKEITL